MTAVQALEVIAFKNKDDVENDEPATLEKGEQRSHLTPSTSVVQSFISFVGITSLRPNVESVT